MLSGAEGARGERRAVKKRRRRGNDRILRSGWEERPSNHN
jgi:hypothetical protein